MKNSIGRFVFLFLFLILLFVFNSESQNKMLMPPCGGTVGPNNPGTTYTIAIGGSTSTWSDITNVASSDNAYATNTTDLAANGNYTDYLCTRNYGISIGLCDPNDITFGVEISSANASTIKDARVRLIVNGGIQTQCNHATNSAFWTTTDTYRNHVIPLPVYCGSLTKAIVESEYFGLALAVKRASAAGAAGTAKVDHMRLTVSWGAAPMCVPDGDDTCRVLTNLPVELTSFELFSTKRNQVDLEWTTISENNNDYFTIERSADGVNYTPVGTVDGAGNSMSMLQYKFTDVSAPAGENYYRLQQTDFDGQVTTSRLRWVWVKSDNDIFVTYSDDAKEATIHFLELPQVMPHIVFVNSMGQYVKVPINTEDMLDGHLKIDLSPLPAGVYYISVFDNTLKTSKPIVVSN